MTRRKAPRPGRYVVLRETSGNTYSTLGPIADGYDDFAAADAEAKAHGDRFPHQTFIVLQAISRYSHETRAVVTKMVEAPLKATDPAVVQFPRAAVSNLG